MKGKNPLKVLFFGTDDVALATLTKILGVVEKVDVAVYPRDGVGGRVHEVERFAQQQGLSTVQLPEQLEDFQGGPWDLGVVASFGHKLPEAVLHGFPRGLVNMHPSLLPRFRGAAPIVHALMKGDAETGVTVQQVASKMDAGRILLQQRTAIGPLETHGELRPRLANLGGEAMAQVLSDLDSYEANAQEQVIRGPEDRVMARKLKPDDLVARFEAHSAAQLFNQWRGLTPKPGLAAFYHHDHRRRVKLLQVQPPTARPGPSEPSLAVAGAVILDPLRDVLWVRCAQASWLPVQTLQLDSRAPMSAQAFYSGFIRSSLSTHTPWFFADSYPTPQQ